MLFNKMFKKNKLYTIMMSAILLTACGADDRAGTAEEEEVEPIVMAIDSQFSMFRNVRLTLDYHKTEVLESGEDKFSIENVADVVIGEDATDLSLEVDPKYDEQYLVATIKGEGNKGQYFDPVLGKMVSLSSSDVLHAIFKMSSDAKFRIDPYSEMVYQRVAVFAGNIDVTDYKLNRSVNLSTVNDTMYNRAVTELSTSLLGNQASAWLDDTIAGTSTNSYTFNSPRFLVDNTIPNAETGTKARFQTFVWAYANAKLYADLQAANNKVLEKPYLSYAYDVSYDFLDGDIDGRSIWVHKNNANTRSAPNSLYKATGFSLADTDVKNIPFDQNTGFDISTELKNKEARWAYADKIKAVIQAAYASPTPSSLTCSSSVSYKLNSFELLADSELNEGVYTLEGKGSPYCDLKIKIGDAEVNTFAIASDGVFKVQVLGKQNEQSAISVTQSKPTIDAQTQAFIDAKPCTGTNCITVMPYFYNESGVVNSLPRFWGTNITQPLAMPTKQTLTDLRLLSQTISGEVLLLADGEQQVSKDIQVEYKGNNPVSLYIKEATLFASDALVAYDNMTTVQKSALTLVSDLPQTSLALSQFSIRYNPDDLRLEVKLDNNTKFSSVSISQLWGREQYNGIFGKLPGQQSSTAKIAADSIYDYFMGSQKLGSCMVQFNPNGKVSVYDAGKKLLNEYIVAGDSMDRLIRRTNEPNRYMMLLTNTNDQIRDIALFDISEGAIERLWLGQTTSETPDFSDTKSGVTEDVTVKYKCL